MDRLATKVLKQSQNDLVLSDVRGFRREDTKAQGKLLMLRFNKERAVVVK